MKRLLVISVWLALAAIAPAEPPAIDSQTAIQIEALNRLKGIDLEAQPAFKTAVLKVLEKTRGTPHFVEIVQDFGIKGQSRELLAYALKYPDQSSGVAAFRMAAAELGRPEIQKLLTGENGPAVVSLIGNSNDQDLGLLLETVVTDAGYSVAVRKEAVRALARSEDGARFLLELARTNKLPPDVKLTASSELSVARWPDIKQQASELLPLPQTNAEPIPPISELVKRRGDPRHGAEVFASERSACSTCHQVNGHGTDFGPPLSEIGTKLGKDALYESILDPSAGISFGYEGWSLEMKNGDEAFGIIASETDEEVILKTQQGISTKYKKSEIAKRQKLSASIMPAGLQLNLSTQELVDLIEYLSTLKKAD